MKTAVVIFPGSNCDRDVICAARETLGREVVPLWHRETAIRGCYAYTRPDFEAALQVVADADLGRLVLGRPRVRRDAAGRRVVSRPRVGRFVGLVPHAVKVLKPGDFFSIPVA